MKVKNESEDAQLCPTLSNPMDCSLPGPSIHGIFQARVLEWAAIAFSDHTPTRMSIIKNIELLCCTSETNILLYENYTSILKN